MISSVIATIVSTQVSSTMANNTDTTPAIVSANLLYQNNDGLVNALYQDNDGLVNALFEEII